MADFSKLINDITESIKANGVGDITGNVLQARLLELITAANEGKQDVIADLDTIRTNAQQAFTQIQTILGPDTTPAIVKFQEIINFLEGISDSESLDAIIKSIESQIAGKQDAIAGLTNDSFLAIKEDSENALKNAATALNNTQGLISSKQDKIADLETIREGAAKGMTALQKEVYTGTVSGVKMNNTTKNPVNGIVDLGTVLTQHQDISGKVDKEEGKQLSTEDFTTALKMKLEALSNYDDTELSKAILTLKTQLETLIGGNASDKIDSFNEIIAFLDSVKDSEDLASVIASIEEQIALKADTASLSKVATSGSYKDLSNVPTKLSDFLNDEVYLNQALADTLYIRQDTPTLSTFATKDDLKGKQDAITGLTNESFASIKENELTALQNAAAALNTANGLVSTKQDKIDGLTNKVFATIQEDVDSALKNAAAALNTANGLVSSKQDKITDIATIRSNASLGASAYNTLSGYNLHDISENASLGATAYSSLSGYLPKSGGTLTGALTLSKEGSDIFVINRLNSSSPTTITYRKDNSLLGRMGFDASTKEPIAQVSGTYQTLIHSGNIGSQKVAGLATARTIWGQSFDGTGNVSGNMTIGNNIIYNGNSQNVIDLTSGMAFGYGIRDTSNITYWALNHAFYSGNSRAMTINSSGNVTIGGSDLAGTSAKLYVNGKLRTQYINLENGNEINCFLDNGDSAPLCLNYSCSGNILLGFGGGNVGIGTSSPAYKLDVIGDFCVNRNDHANNNTTLRISTSDNDVYFYADDADDAVCNLSFVLEGTERLILTSGGDTSVIGSLSVSGAVTASAFYMSSDETLKDFGKDIEIDFERLKNLPKKYFTWKSGGDKQIGTSAQEVQKLFPEIVGKNANGTLTVDYSRLTMPALAAIDKLYTENQQLKERVSNLEKMICHG